ncbi:sulfatase-like hydrolase/transferase [Salinirubellus salinus]|uniref:Sulfatase-like hydrolase/transferase n=1 Tax=Salinirubellus salinus TaxID=1364945 RepID=A0A9E7UAR3_9EURY|nr:sulfatase-like hydrolase/transferase [Salinirubellus salinus]UWM54317.1 sulfatase-like hydrolase/transferase [Salinirubellus salinus]
MTDGRPNVVLVSIDSLRADHCGYVGASPESGLTQTLDCLAADGVAFRNAIAPGPQTFSSMPATFTGVPRAPAAVERHGDAYGWERRLTTIATHLERYPSLAERLHDRGYTTAALTPNPWTSTAAQFEAGFDRFLDRSATGQHSRLSNFISRIPQVDVDTKPLELGLNMLTNQSFFSNWESFYDDLLDLRAGLREPYFLWVFLMDTHIPYITRRAHRQENSVLEMYYGVLRSEGAMRGRAESVPPSAVGPLERSYRDTVRAVDAFLARLRSDLAADDPVWVVHSDHGESLGEHGNWGHHHRNVYEENLHVPFVVANAGVQEVVDEPVSLTAVPDLVETLARGRQFVPRAMTSPFVFASSECGRFRTVRGRRFKYVDGDGDAALYDLSNDPDERRDVAPSFPAVARELRRHLDGVERHRSEQDRIERAAAVAAAEDPTA